MTGRLPPGEHEAEWDEVVNRFGRNRRHRQLLDGLAEFFQNERDTGDKGIVVIDPRRIEQ
ncbi:MAG: DUF6932 family protein [Acidimicrobiales bacterium]